MEQKQDATPVTIADRQAEQLLRERTSPRAFPTTASWAKSFPNEPGTSGFRWIVDPIDGTKSFVSGVPLYGTLIGLEHQGRSVLGVIHLPALGRNACGALAGDGAWFQRGGDAPQPAKVSDRGAFWPRACSAPARSPPSPSAAAPRPTWQLEAAMRVARTWGDCYGYSLVATGEPK